MATKRKDLRGEVDEIARLPYTVELEYGETPDEGVLAYLAEWPDCFAAGRTREEAVAALGDAVRALALYRLAHQLSVPRPTVEYGGRVLVQMPKSLHRDVQQRAEREGVSMNQWISTTLARVIGRIEPIGGPRRRYGYGARKRGARAKRPTRARR